MNDIIEVYDEYRHLGIKTRKITKGIEFDLVREFIDFRKDKFKASDKSKLAIFIEPMVNNSYPDIVFVNYNPECFTNWNASRMELTVIDYKVLYCISCMTHISSNDIIGYIGITNKEVSQSIKKLYASGFIIEKNKSWQVKHKKVFGVMKIESVEVKMNKLGEVLHQALTNRSFATESYILSNLSDKLDDRKLKRFNQFGIGVYTTYGQGFKKLQKPIEGTIPVSFSSILFNEWVGSIIMN
ncbi:MAG: hypothetical protein COA82_04065 [Alkaliphilus sp.]|nr:MAG: hypothetical protein COA82_04065 [Alkaliphilus sp.]